MHLSKCLISKGVTALNDLITGPNADLGCIIRWTRMEVFPPEAAQIGALLTQGLDESKGKSGVDSRREITNGS
jgi:hypothetical protein